MAWWEAPLLSLAACIVARRFQLVFIIICTVDFVTWWQSFSVTSSVAVTRLVSLASFSIAALVSNHKCSMNLPFALLLSRTFSTARLAATILFCEAECAIFFGLGSQGS